MDAELELLDASLPGTLPVYPGISLAGRYVLTDQPPPLRGDGMKAISLPGSRIALMIGDVVGSGATAPTTMARLLAILRDRLQEGADALAALRYADRYAASTWAARGASVAIAVISLIDGTVEYAGAGHPPPLHVGRHGARPISLAPSRPLGTGGEGSVTRGHLAPGDFLVMHTDGLLSGDCGGLVDGRERVQRLLASFADASLPIRQVVEDRPDDVCQLLVNELPPAERLFDDVALLVAERTQRPEPFVVSCPATPSVVTRIATTLEQWLENVGAGLLDHLALRQAFTELAMNVVKHAYTDSPAQPGELNVSARLSDDGMLQLTVQDTGRWRQATSGDGRGLIIAGGLVDSLRLDRSPHGTAVTLQQALGRSVPILQASQAPHAEPPDPGDSRRPTPMTTEMVEGCLLVSGAVLERCAQDFQNSVHDATRAGTADASIDLSDVTLLASSAIRVLFDYMARSQASGAHLNVLVAAGSIAEQAVQLVDLPHRSR